MVADGRMGILSCARHGEQERNPVLTGYVYYPFFVLVIHDCDEFHVGRLPDNWTRLLDAEHEEAGGKSIGFEGGRRYDRSAEDGGRRLPRGRIQDVTDSISVGADEVLVVAGSGECLVSYAEGGDDAGGRSRIGDADIPCGVIGRCPDRINVAAVVNDRGFDAVRSQYAGSTVDRESDSDSTEVKLRLRMFEADC